MAFAFLHILTYVLSDLEIFDGLRFHDGLSDGNFQFYEW